MVHHLEIGVGHKGIDVINLIHALLQAILEGIGHQDTGVMHGLRLIGSGIFDQLQHLFADFGVPGDGFGQAFLVFKPDFERGHVRNERGFHLIADGLLDGAADLAIGPPPGQGHDEGQAQREVPHKFV